MNPRQQELAQEAMDFTRLLAQQYFVQRELTEIPQYLDKAVSWIGTGTDEISRTVEEAYHFITRELQEYGGTFQMEERWLKAVPRSDTLCIVYGTMRAVPEDNTLAEEDLRLSLVLEKDSFGMKLVHLHLSRADVDQEQGRAHVTKAARSDTDTLRRTLDIRGRQLENLTKHIPGGVHQSKNDADLTLISMSDSFLTMFGYTRGEIETLFHNRFLEMIYPADREAMAFATREQLKLGPNIELEYRVMCKNGLPVWILDKGRLLDDGRGGECFYCLLIEITERKQEQEALRLSLERHQVIMDQATDIIFEWDIRADTLKFSPNWRKKFGYDPIELQISKRIPRSKEIHPDDMPAFVKIMGDTAAGVPYSEAEFRIRTMDRRYRWCRIRATAQFGSEGDTIKAVGVIIDIDAEKKQKQVLLEMAQRDALTGLYNKAVAGTLVERRMLGGDPAILQALFILDVDYFKLVNDTYGHMAGDSLLSDVAAALRNHVRATDVVGRIGGDEFLIYLPEVADEAAALAKGEEIHTTLGLLSPEQGAPPITCSIGVAVFFHGNVSYTNLCQCADQALYHSKNNGRNRVTVYEPALCGGEVDCNYSRATLGLDGGIESNAADEQLSQYAFRMLYAAQDIASTLTRLLEIIGRSFDVSRAYIFESSEDGRRCSNTFEWCAEGVTPQLDELQEISYLDDLGDYLSNFNADGLFYCAEVQNTHPGVRAVLEPQGIHSMLQCAMLDEGAFAGYVGFDECRENRVWTTRQVASFKLTADVLSTFLLKLRQKRRIASATGHKE